MVKCPKCDVRGLGALGSHVDSMVCRYTAAHKFAHVQRLRSIRDYRVSRLCREAGFKVVHLPTILIRTSPRLLRFVPHVDARAASVCILTAYRDDIPRKRRLHALKLVKRGGSAAEALVSAATLEDLVLFNTILDANQRRF